MCGVRAMACPLAAIGRKYLPDTDTTQLRAAAIHEQRGRVTLPSSFGLASRRLLSTMASAFLANRTIAFLVALADAANTADLGIEIGDAAPSELRYTQAGRVQNLRAMARSRKPRGVFASGWLSTRSTSSRRRLARQGTSDLRRFEGSRKDLPKSGLGSGAKRKKLRRVTRCRATVLLSSFCR